MALLVSLPLLVSLLAGCGIQSGDERIAFLRDGALWSVAADGSAPIRLAGGQIVGYAWSPDHHQLVFRASKVAFGQEQTLPPDALLGAPDATGNLGDVSVSGGTALQISPDAHGVLRSDAWWNPNGNRLLYREDYPANTVAYLVSQSDQAVGIARKLAFGAVGVPALSPDGARVAILDANGDVRVGAPNTTGASVASGALLTTPEPGGVVRPARALWQPHHDAVAFPVGVSGGVAIELRRLDASGAGVTRTLATTATLLDAAFSPDGSQLLVRTPDRFELWSVDDARAPRFTWPEADPLALPWWSPDGRRLLVQDATGWSVVDTRSHSTRALLTRAASLAETPPPDARWRPATADPWNAAGDHLVFTGVAGSRWNGAPLPDATGGVGLYTAALAGTTPGSVTLLESAPDRAPSWSYADTSTTFLIAG